MSQHDMNLANQNGSAFRADANAAIGALVSLSSGSTEPATRFAGMLWLDTSGGGNGVLKMRNLSNTAWVVPPVTIAWDGGTVSNQISIVKTTDAHAVLKLQKGGATRGNLIEAYDEVGVIVWRLYLGTAAADDFALNRYNDTGAFISTALTVSRATGIATFANGIAFTTGSSGIDMNGGKITELGVPTLTTDAATKKYVDDSILAAGGLWNGGTVTQGINIMPVGDVSAILKLQKGTAAQSNRLDAYNEAGLPVWRVFLGYAAADDYVLNRYDDAGAFINSPMMINRLSGLATFNNGMSVTGGTLAMNNNRIAGVGTPTVSTDAATKAYVDAASSADDIRLDALEADKAPLLSPAFSGNPTAPTPTTADNDTSIATTAFVKAAIASAGIGVGIPEAPTDGQQYGRRNAAWSVIVATGAAWNGGTVTNPTDFQAAVTVLAPTLAGHAVTKTYADTKAASEAAAAVLSSIARDGTRPPTVDMPWGGWRMTALGNPVDPQDAVTKFYVDALASSTIAGAITRDNSQGPTTDINWSGFRLMGLADPVAPTDATHKAYVDAKFVSGGGGIPDAPTDGQKYARQNANWAIILDAAVWNGGVVDNPATFNAAVIVPEPGADPHAATKLYVDTKAVAEGAVGGATAIARDGTRPPTTDIGWGNYRLTLLGDPLGSQDAATKIYVDSVIAGAVGIPEAPVDGQQYARSDGTWEVVVATGGGGFQDHLEAPGGISNWYGWGGTAWEWRATPGGALNARISSAGDGLFNGLEGTSLWLSNLSKYVSLSYDGAAHALRVAVDATGAAVPYFFTPTNFITPGTVTLGAAPSTAMHATTKTYVDTALAATAPLASPVFTGNPTAPTPTAGDNDTSLATTAFVTAAVAAATSAGAPVNSPVFTGDPQAPTPVTGDNDNSIATTAYVKAQGYATVAALAAYALLASPAFSGNPTAPTPTAGDSDTSIATTAFVAAAIAASGHAPIADPLFTGNARSTTPPTADNDTSIATTAFVKAVLNPYYEPFEIDSMLLTKANLASPAFTGVVTGVDYTFSGKARLTSTAEILTIADDLAPLQIGQTATANMVLDKYNIQGRFNGGIAPIYLNYLGGTVNIGNAAATLSTLMIKGAHGNNYLQLHSKYDGDSSASPEMEFFSDRASWTANDFAGAIRFKMGDPAGTSKTVGYLTANVWDITSGTEKSNLYLGTTSAGASVDALRLSEGIVYAVNGKFGFPATANPSTNPNILDDYEEGTWTPRVYGSTTAGTGTYSVQSARYTKYGRLVHVDMMVSITAHTGAGMMFVDGLPFTPASSYGSGFSGYLAQAAFTGQIYFVMNSAGVIQFSTMTSGAVTGLVTLDPSCSFQLSGVYTAAS